MHNQNFFRSFENGNDDDRILNDGIVSIIGDDYLLNFLNESEPNPKTNKQPNLFSQMFQEGPAAFPGFQDQPRPSDSFANMYSKMSMHDPWMLSNMVEPQKNPTQIGLGYKIENPDELEGSSKSKKIKTEKETSLNVKRPSEVSNKNKNNTKNTYINKINTLISEESEIEVKPEVPKMYITQSINDLIEISSLEAMKPESKKSLVIKDETEPQISVIPKPSGMKKVRSYDVLKSDECDKLNVKLARNRESARKSRKRKKVYIELLEKKVDQLQQELDETKKQLEQNSSSLSKANVQNKILGGLHSAEQTLIEKLESMIGAKSDETEISFLIDSLRLRLGTTGKERISAINYFYKQLLEYLVPVHMKYLLWASVEGKDLFSNRDANLLNSIPPNIIGKGDFQNESTDYWQEIASQLNMTENQKKNVLKYKKKLTVEKQKLETIVNNMNQARKDLLKQTKSVQDVVDDFSSIFSPAQFGKFLINIDKEKNRKEFRADKLWIAPAMKKENGGDLSDDSDDFLEESDIGPSSMEQERNNESMRLSEAAYDFEPIRQTKRNNSKKMS